MGTCNQYSIPNKNAMTLELEKELELCLEKSIPYDGRTRDHKKVSDSLSLMTAVIGMTRFTTMISFKIGLGYQVGYRYPPRIVNRRWLIHHLKLRQEIRIIAYRSGATMRSFASQLFLLLTGVLHCQYEADAFAPIHVGAPSTIRSSSSSLHEQATTATDYSFIPSKEGILKVTRQLNDSTNHDEYNLAYRIFRPMSLSSRKAAPILVLHGGPSVPSDYLYPLVKAVPYRSIVFYDQLGCGGSDEPNDKNAYSIEKALDDLEALLKKLSIRRFHLYGQCT
jgi:hypothetical protein